MIDRSLLRSMRDKATVLGMIRRFGACARDPEKLAMTTACVRSLSWAIKHELLTEAERAGVLRAILDA
jgi:hypothetical protein